MSRFNYNPSQEYRAFVKEVREYAQSDHELGENVRRAIADALSDELRERFKNAWKVDEQAETPCLQQLITGEDECNCDRSWIDRELESIGEGDKPPHSDHASLWLDDHGCVATGRNDRCWCNMPVAARNVQQIHRSLAILTREMCFFDLPSIYTQNNRKIHQRQALKRPVSPGETAEKYVECWSNVLRVYGAGSTIYLFFDSKNHRPTGFTHQIPNYFHHHIHSSS